MDPAHTRGEQYFALKQMLCQAPEQTAAARREVAVCAGTDSPFLAPLLAAAVDEDRSHDRGQDRGSGMASLLFPYYPLSCQDVLHAGYSAVERDPDNLQYGGPRATFFDEAECLWMLLGLARGLRSLHQRTTSPVAHRDVCPRNVMLRYPLLRSHRGAVSILVGAAGAGGAGQRARSRTGGAGYAAVARGPVAGQDTASGDNAQKVAEALSSLESAGIPWPVLIDFGSAREARVWVSSRSEALALAEQAATESSMPYRSPELFDAPTGCVVDERSDIWSLGATVFALAFGYSPFESERTERGTLRLADCSHLRVLGAVQFPTARSHFSAAFADLLLWMLRPDPAQRPSAAQVEDRARNLLLQTLQPAAATGPQAPLQLPWPYDAVADMRGQSSVPSADAELLAKFG
jgi:serine/threonine kinase 16